MKIFTIQSKIVNDQPQTVTVTANLSIDEVRLIVLACERLKPQSNEIVESIRTSIIDTFKNY